MAYVLQAAPTAVVKASVWDKTTHDSDGMVSFGGITIATTTADNIITQVNKILAFANKEIATPEGMTRTRTEEAIDDGND